MLGLVFGATTVAISAVLAAFMGGLALGSALAARFAARIKRPVRAYAFIEIAVGLYALAVPFSVSRDRSSLRPGMAALSSRLLWFCVFPIPARNHSPLDSHGVDGRYASSSGGRSPAILGKYCERGCEALHVEPRRRDHGSDCRGLFPAAAVWRSRTTIWIAAATNLAIGLAAFLLDSKSVGIQTGVVDEVRRDQIGEINRPLPQAVLTRKFWLFCAFTSGFVTISMQVVWSRVLAMIIGSSTYAFSIVLGLFLVGLALGAWLVSTNKNADARWLRRAVLVIEILTAFTLFLSLRITSATPDFLISAAPFDSASTRGRVCWPCRSPQPRC